MYVCDSAEEKNSNNQNPNETKDRLQLHAIAVTLLHILSREQKERKKSIKRLRCKYLMQW